MSTRAERMRYVAKVRREIEADERANPPRPTTAAQRKRIVEVLALEAGLPPPRWRGAADRRRDAGELIDDSPWRASREASLRAQHERFGRYGLAMARDRSIRCVKCGEVVLAIPRGRVSAIGTPASALARLHEQKGCRPSPRKEFRAS